MIQSETIIEQPVDFPKARYIKINSNNRVNKITTLNSKDLE